MFLTKFSVLHVAASSFWTISTISAGLSLVNNGEASQLICTQESKTSGLTQWRSPEPVSFQELCVLSSSSRPHKNCTWTCRQRNHLSVIGRKWSHHPRYSPTTPTPDFFLQMLNFKDRSTKSLMKLANCVCEGTSNHLSPEGCSDYNQ